MACLHSCRYCCGIDCCIFSFETWQAEPTSVDHPHISLPRRLRCFHALAFLLWLAGIPMSTETPNTDRPSLSVLLSLSIILYAVVSGAWVLRKTAVDPRTDDAEIFANFIGISPVVNGPIT